jgi:Arc/MetJ-type ribon-helix-helix transcriptional regulator
MAELQINLPDPISAYAGAQVASGRFPTIHDYLGALVSADQQEQAAIRQLSDNPRLAALLEEGLASAEGRAWTPAVFQELKQQVFDRAAGNSM